MMRTIKRAWRLWLIVVLLLGVGYIVFVHDSYSPGVADGAYEWRFSQQGSGEKTSTKVMLKSSSGTYDLGEYDGTCAVEEGDYMEYEKSRVVCWFGVRGQEIGVFEEPGQVVVRVGDIDEGASGVSGFRGNFVLLKRL